MVCCTCCRSSLTTQTVWSILVLIGAGAVLGAGIWAWAASQDLKTTTHCVLEQYDLLMNGTAPNAALEQAGQDGHAGADMIGMVSQGAIDRVNSFLDHWRMAWITPGAAAFAILAVAAACALIGMCLTAKRKVAEKCCAPTSKLLITLGYVALLLAGSFFVLCAALGISSSVGPVEEQWVHNVEAPCHNATNLVDEQLSTAKSLLDWHCAQNGTASSCRELLADYRFARQQADEFERFCSCATAWLDEARPLTAPGILGVTASLLCIVFASGLCAALGGFKSYTSNVDLEDGGAAAAAAHETKGAQPGDADVASPAVTTIDVSSDEGFQDISPDKQRSFDAAEFEEISLGAPVAPTAARASVHFAQ